MTSGIEDHMKKLFTRGKERGYVTYDELKKALPPEQVSSEQIEDTMAMLSELVIKVIKGERSPVVGGDATTPTRICKKCGEEKPATDDFFNILPSGNFRGACKKCMRANTKRHYYNDPGKVKDRVEAYKARQAASPGRTTDAEKARKRRAFGDRCYFCGKYLRGSGEWDHDIPVSKGGTNWVSNMLLCCRKCNRDKHDKTAEAFVEWMKERGRPFRFDTEPFPK